MSKESFNEYHRQYKARRYAAWRKGALEYLGGKCIQCEAVFDLQIDHKNRSEREMRTDALFHLCEEKWKRELDKCQLLCRSCHIRKTISELGQNDARIVHGTLSSYRYCRCDLCRAAKSAHSKQYKRKLKLSLTGVMDNTAVL